jgi:hypothetical protein
MFRRKVFPPSSWQTCKPNVGKRGMYIGGGPAEQKDLRKPMGVRITREKQRRFKCRSGILSLRSLFGFPSHIFPPFIY